MTEVILVSLDLIDANPWQPRTSEETDHLANLAVSIADDGLMQIPSARRVGERYQLAFGHSRKAGFALLKRLQQTALLSELCVEPDSAMARAWQAAQTALENLVDFEQMPLNAMEIDDETMFRFAVSENVQRRDLNAIETAQAMLRYKADFGRSSAEIGALFGVNDSTVRGTLRLLDLPAGARGLLAKGEISQGAARALLAARPLVSAATLDKIAEKISTEAGNLTYPRVVREMLNNAPGLKLMWQDGKEGEPRAGDSWGNTPRWWPLKMTNFPNRWLPELTLSDLPTALQAEKETVLLRLIAHSQSPLEVEFKLTDWGNEHADERAKELASKINLLLDPPSACNTCPLHAKVEGAYFCGLEACHKRKKVAWDAEKIYSASRELKIALYTEEDGPFLDLDWYKPLQKDLWTKRGPDLRLIHRSQVKGYPSQYSMKGIDTDLFVAVVVGQSLADLKAEMKAERAREKAGQQTMTRSTLYAAHKERLVWEAGGILAGELLGMLNLASIEALATSCNLWFESGPTWAQPIARSTDEFRFDYYQHKLGINMLYKLRSGIGYRDSSLVEYCEVLKYAFAKTGVEFPLRLLAEAKELDFQIEEQFPTVSAETVKQEELSHV